MKNEKEMFSARDRLAFRIMESWSTKNSALVLSPSFYGRTSTTIMYVEYNQSTIGLGECYRMVGNLKRKTDDKDGIIPDVLHSDKKPKRASSTTTDDGILKRTEREFTTALVTNLPKNTNVKSINNFFQICGEIKDTKFIKSCQLAKVQLSNREELLSALTMNFKHFNNNVQSNIINVKPYENSSLWVTNYPPEYNYIDLKKLFENAIGKDTIFEVRLPSLKFNSNKRFAYIDIISYEHCISAIKLLNETDVENYKIVVRLNKSHIASESTKDNAEKSSGESINEKELYLTNLKEQNNDEEIFTALKMKCGCLAVPNEEHFEGSIKRLDRHKQTGFSVFKDKKCVSNIMNASNKNKKDCFINLENNKVFFQKVESKGYLERVKFKKMVQLGQKYNEFDHWVSLFPLLEDKIYYLNKYQLRKYLENEIPGIKVVDVLLVSDYKGVLIKLDSEISASKLKLKLNNTKLLKYDNVTYAKDHIKCQTITDLIQSDDAPKKQISKPTPYSVAKSSLPKKDRKINIETNTKEAIITEMPKNIPDSNEVMSNDDFRNLFK